MKNFFYFGTIRKTIIQFLDIFKDIKIAKYDDSGEINKYVQVPVKFMPKQKWYSWLEHRTHEKRFPSMGIQINNIEYDQSRHTGKHEDIALSINNSDVQYYQNPVPYNIVFQVRIATNYVSEMDQIIEQILPYCSPYVVNNIKIDELDLDWDINIKFDGLEIDQEIDIEDYRSNEWTLNFTVQTYILKPALDSETKLIKKVVNKIYTSKESWNKRDTTTDMPSGQGSEDEELLILASKEDGKILFEYEVFE